MDTGRLAGVFYLGTFVSGLVAPAVSTLARALRPYNYVPGILAEGTLTVWLLLKGARA